MGKSSLSLPLSMGTSSTSCQRLRTTNVPTMVTRVLTLAGWVPMRRFLTCHRAWLTQRLTPIVKPVLEGMIKEGRPYTGVLYAGLILTADGPKVIEFNSRFGDPETQIILPRLTSDFAQNITDILDGKEPAITWTDKGVTLGVVVASNGYPLAYEKGVKLPAKTEGDIITYYAGAKFAENGQDLLLKWWTRLYAGHNSRHRQRRPKHYLQRTQQTKHRRPLLPYGYR